MSKKLKDWYDLYYVKELADTISRVYPEFNAACFYDLVKNDLETLELGERQLLLAQSLKAIIPLNYTETIELFHKILGPELKDNYGNFSEGYWLWPIGKYVELYGAEELESSLHFSKELTKRFTSEYCMRPLIMVDPPYVMKVLIDWSIDKNVRVRRLASECVRIRLPWAKKMTIALDHFEEYKSILCNLKNDSNLHIKKSVANNLNDLYKENPEKFKEIVDVWKIDPSENTKWIIKHGSRNIK